MILDHLGIAVPSLSAATPAWERMFGYRPASQVIANTRQQVRVVFLRGADGSMVKLIEPATGSSPIARFVARGGGLHHLCFRCDQLARTIEELRGAGARLLVPPQPGEAFRNHPIAFLLAPGNLNLELIDTAEKDLDNRPPC